jgi:hypothetical protein
MTRLYDSDVALVLVLVVLGFLMWLPTDVHLRQAADDLCLQLCHVSSWKWPSNALTQHDDKDYL